MVRFSFVVLLATAASAQAQIASLDTLESVAAVAFTEGPAWHPSGNCFFTDVANNRIMRRDPNGAMHVFRRPSGRANGLLFDLQGRLICCEGAGPEGNRRVTRTEHNGTVTVLADRFDEKRFNSPNDVTLDSNGRIYFTDPRYGSKRDVEQFDSEGKRIEGVYRIDDVGKVERIITHEVDRPNGITVSPDDKWLFVADNVNDGENAEGGNRKLWRFALNTDGTVESSSRKLLFDWGTDRGPDGITIDTDGNIYAAAGFNFARPPVETASKYKAGVYVISPEGKLLQTIPVPADMITNCTFGGEDRSTLFITAGHKLWSVQTKATGFVPFLSKKN